MESDLRQKFEAYKAGCDLSRWKSNGEYVRDGMEEQWETYRAAYTAGLREAAGICKDLRNGSTYDGPSYDGVPEERILARADESEKGR